ncbi:MAG: hypothetical protein WC880_03455 [Candidatus Paceibacterota bacterium]
MSYHPEDCFKSPYLNRRALIPLDQRPDMAPSPEERLILKEEALRGDPNALKVFGFDIDDFNF